MKYLAHTLGAMILSYAVAGQAFDFQGMINKGVGNAVTGAVEGKSGKEILKDTGNAAKEDVQQQAQQTAADYAKQAPTADTNPMGAIATDIAAQKAAQKAGNNGQLASDLIKGASGALQSKMTGQPAATDTATPTPAADTSASAATPTATAHTTKKASKKASKKKKKHK